MLVKYLEIYLSDLEQWLKEWKLSNNVLKRSVMPFAKAGRAHSKTPTSATLCGAKPMG